MGLLSTRSRHSCSVTCSWLTPFWETEFGTSARDQFGAMVSRPPDVYWVSTDAAVWRTVQTTAAFPRPIRETEWGEGLLLANASQSRSMPTRPAWRKGLRHADWNRPKQSANGRRNSSRFGPHGLRLLSLLAPCLKQVGLK